LQDKKSPNAAAIHGDTLRFYASRAAPISGPRTPATKATGGEKSAMSGNERRSEADCRPPVSRPGKTRHSTATGVFQASLVKNSRRLRRISAPSVSNTKLKRARFDNFYRCRPGEVFGCPAAFRRVRPAAASDETGYLRPCRGR
jgi:hypothetical protein